MTLCVRFDALLNFKFFKLYAVKLKYTFQCQWYNKSILSLSENHLAEKVPWHLLL